MWEETDDLVYLEEKSKLLRKKLERLNRIKRRVAEGAKVRPSLGEYMDEQLEEE